MADKEPNKLDEVNATLDRFAKLIEDNARQLREDKAEYERQRAKDKAEYERQRAKDKADAAEAEARWERQRSKDKADAEARWEQERAEDRARDERWERERAEDRARDERWERERAEDRVRDEQWEKRLANVNSQVGGQANTIGDITEAMTISDNILDLINEFEEIEVTHFDFNTRKKYPVTDADGKQIRKQYEVDGLAYGQEVAVVIEAKTTLTKDYVEYFVKKLPSFKLAYPDHVHKKIYGAVTFIRASDFALDLAEQEGLFIIKTSPPDVTLVNHQGFKPTRFA